MRELRPRRPAGDDPEDDRGGKKKKPNDTGKKKTQKTKQDSEKKDSGSKGEKSDAPLPPIKELIVVHQPEEDEKGKKGKKGSKPKKTSENFERLSQELKRWQNRREATGDLARFQAASFDRDELEAEHAKRAQAVRELKKSSEKPTKAATKAAENYRDDIRDLLTKIKNAAKSKKFDREPRKNEADQESFAQSALEDFLYYQDALRRWKRSRMVDPKERAELQAERPRTGASYTLALSGKQDSYLNWLHDVLDLYDERDIGNAEYKQGQRDHLGNIVTRGRVVTRMSRRAVGPNELHLWTPSWRREPVGLPRRINVDEATGRGREDENGNEIFEYKQPDPREIESEDLELDEKAIERRRSEIESQTLSDHDGNPLEYETHTDRRLREMAIYESGTLMPNTSNLRLRNKGGELEPENRWRQLSNQHGLFISAKERSWDWLTSYDSLNWVKSGRMPESFPISAVRVEGPSGSSRTNAGDADYITTRNYPSEDDGDLEKTPEPEEGGAPGVAGGRKSRKAQSKEMNAGEEEEEEEEEEESRSWLKCRANIDYPYEQREFAQDRKMPDINGDDDKHFDTTTWFEMTDGRREWHVYQQLQPYSPVNSPPHVPIRPGILENQAANSVPHKSAAPDIWKVVPDEEVEPLELGSRRRCRHRPERCRAWWEHPAEECWVVDSKRMRGPDAPETAKYGNEFEDPADIQDDGEDAEPDSMTLTMPEGNIDIYRARLYDHYGVMPHGTSRWPKRGVRIPYEPMTYDDRKLDRGRRPTNPPQGDHVGKAGDDSCIAKDARKRVVHSIRSMDVPIITRPERDWGVVGADPPPGRGHNSGDDEAEPEDDEDSDDDGDLFRKSYLEGSTTVGADSAADGQTDPANDPLATQPTDAPTGEEPDDHDDLYDD